MCGMVLVVGAGGTAGVASVGRGKGCCPVHIVSQYPNTLIGNKLFFPKLSLFYL